MLNVANAITLLRFALVPAIGLQLWRADYRLAFALFVTSAVSDLADGVVARRWNQATRFGAVADPLADKLTMLTVTGLLALQGALPWWCAVAVALRDGLIVGGALAFHVWIGPVEMAPSRISKVNTALQFALLLATLAIQAGLAPNGLWWRLLLVATMITIAWSGLQYVLVWGRKAARSAQKSS